MRERERDTVNDCHCVTRQILCLKSWRAILSSSLLLIILCSRKLQKATKIKQRDTRRCQKWLNDQVRSDGGFQNSDRSSLQHLTLSLKEDNEGWESSSLEETVLAHWGRCGDVVTGKAGCVSKQELPALYNAALAPHLVKLLPSLPPRSDYCSPVPMVSQTFSFPSCFIL